MRSILRAVSWVSAVLVDQVPVVQGVGNAVRWIAKYSLSTIIYFIVIFVVARVIHTLNNRRFPTGTST